MDGGNAMLGWFCAGMVLAVIMTSVADTAQLCTDGWTVVTSPLLRGFEPPVRWSA